MRTAKEIGMDIECLIRERGETVKDALIKSGVGRALVDHMKNGSMATADKLLLVADYLGVSIDRILRGADSDSQELTIPSALQGVPAAFHRGEFENLTQDEVDSLARIAVEYKALREKHSKS